MKILNDLFVGTKLGAVLQSCRESRRLVLVIVAIALLLDNMLLTSVARSPQSNFVSSEAEFGRMRSSFLVSVAVYGNSASSSFSSHSFFPASGGGGSRNEKRFECPSPSSLFSSAWKWRARSGCHPPAASSSSDSLIPTLRHPISLSSVINRLTLPVSISRAAGANQRGNALKGSEPRKCSPKAAS
ncbi:hypothetical protein J437_LFUL003164 [Ladona fulva]|uniref:Uncharacterized protein n=1 Tax=Ladona fulva TaxID=123851 RepID=A0A8K0KVI9_LADFU|nr:hypothetical protein J437_LFUL003164 [Ladona fulva]